MNWVLLTTITLTLANPLNIGLACNNTTGVTQAQFDKVEVQAQTDEESVTVTQTLGPDGGSIVVDFMGQPREVIFAPGALLADIPIKVTATTSVDTTYPPTLSQDSSFKPQLLEYVGPQIIVEVSKDALDWNNADGAKPLFGVNSGLNIPFNYDLHLSYEIRISLSGDDISMEFQRYFEGDYAAILAGGISALDSYGLPDVIKFSIQIVDYSEMDKQASIGKEINTLSPSAHVAEGVFSLDDVTLDFDAYCSGRKQVMPPNTPEITGSINVLEDKTPLLLIHGWTVMGEILDGINALPFVGDYFIKHSDYELAYWAG